MVKVIATGKGYFGGEVREIGASFEVPDELWSDKKRRPSWAKLDPGVAFGGKGDHDGDGKVGGSKPAEPKPAAIVIPADWRNLKAPDRKALATSITGTKAPNAADADRVIEAYLESHKPEVFGDAPAPETAKGSGLQDALGGVQPDWVAPNDQ